MKKTIKNIITMLIISSILIIFSSIQSQAVLQANPNTDLRTNVETFINGAREMECENGALGFNEELNEDLTYKGQSNGIDMHMMRNTEYGAILILSASGYGNPNNDMSCWISSGNDTGVVYTDYVSTAGFITGTFPNINTIYYDNYTGDGDSAKIGDATDICDWHGSWDNWWISEEECFCRNYYTSYSGYRGFFSLHPYNIWSNFHAYGVASCGDGL